MPVAINVVAPINMKIPLQGNHPNHPLDRSGPTRGGITRTNVRIMTMSVPSTVPCAPKRHLRTSIISTIIPFRQDRLIPAQTGFSYNPVKFVKNGGKSSDSFSTGQPFQRCAWPKL